jgi:hypothetical protein
MSYPQPPEILTSYTAQEQALGDGTLPGQELDVDLAAIRASVTAVIEFVKQVTRSDGKLANGIVTQEALGAALIIGFDPPSVWVTATAYTTRSIVFEGTKVYLCVVAHTSSDFATDVSSGRWSLLADLAPEGGGLIDTNNLSDLTDVGNARTNLGLGSMATAAAGTGAAQHRTNLQNEAFFQPLAAALTSWAALTRASGFDTFVAAPTSANLRALLTDETGSGAALFAGGAMGTPASINLANASGLVVGGIAASTLVTAAEGLAANDNDSTIPTSAAVIDAIAAGAPSTILGPTVTTSGTAVDFTGIPAGTREVDIIFSGVSLSGTEHVLVQLGDAGGFETTGYVSASLIISSTSANNVKSTSGLAVYLGDAARAISGVMRLTLGASNQWGSMHGVDLGGASGANGGGTKTLSDVLTQIRLTRTGTDTFDAGSATVVCR